MAKNRGRNSPNPNLGTSRASDSDLRPKELPTVARAPWAQVVSRHLSSPVHVEEKVLCANAADLSDAGESLAETDIAHSKVPQAVRPKSTRRASGISTYGGR